VQAFLDLAACDEQSPLRGRQRGDVTVTDGRIHLASDPSLGETYRDILARHGMDELVVDGAIDPRPAESATAPAGAFTAVFAEVGVDRDLGVLRVARLVSVIDGGRVLNEKTARSQIIGATVMAIGMTLLEETVFDPGTGRIANATFGDYLVPVSADVPDIDVVFVGEPDRFTPIGAKGLGEVGTVGVSAAIAYAVYHTTGRRIRCPSPWTNSCSPSRALLCAWSHQISAGTAPPSVDSARSSAAFVVWVRPEVISGVNSPSGSDAWTRPMTRRSASATDGQGVSPMLSRAAAVAPMSHAARWLCSRSRASALSAPRQRAKPSRWSMSW